jgi:hypothetical protein
MLIIFMSLISKPCAKDIYRILADDKKNKGMGVELGQIEEQLLPRYPVVEINRIFGEMKIVGILKERGWATVAGEGRRMKYEIGDQSEWSALFASTLGYDAEELGIPAYLADK